MSSGTATVDDWRRQGDMFFVSTFTGYKDAPYRIAATRGDVMKFSAFRPAATDNPYRDVGYELIDVSTSANAARQSCLTDYLSEGVIA